MKRTLSLLLAVIFIVLLLAGCSKNNDKKPIIYSYSDSTEPITVYGREIKLEYSEKWHKEALALVDEILDLVKEEKVDYSVIDEKTDAYYDMDDALWDEYVKAYLISDMTGKDEDYLLKDDIYDAYKDYGTYEAKIDLAIYNSKYKHDYYDGMSEEEIEEYISGLNEEGDKELNEAYSKLNSILTSYYIGTLNAFDAVKEYIDCGNKIAKLTGYENYVYYSYTEEYDRDYTPEDTVSLKEYMKKYIIPLYDETTLYLDEFFENGSEERIEQSRVTVRDFEALDKSFGNGITTLQDLETSYEVWKVMLELSQEIGHRLYTYNKKATGIAIDIRSNDLLTKEWQCSLPLATQSASVIARNAFALFSRTYDWRLPIRSVTVRAINLVSLNVPEQIDMFYDANKHAKAESLDKCIEDIRSRFGRRAISFATLLDNPKMPGHGNPNIIMPTGVPI